MGQEIVYCFKCQTRIVGNDFTKGAAYQVGANLSCSKCAAELLHTLPPKEREQLLAQMFKATQERKSGSPATNAPPPASSPRVERRKSGDTGRQVREERSRANLTLAIAGVLVVVSIVVAVVMGSGRSPAPPPETVTKRPVDPPNPTSEPADFRKAREFARANPGDLEGQIAVWRGALLTAGKEPDAETAQKELDRLLALQKVAVKAALAGLDAQAKAPWANEEFAVAATLFRAARSRFAAPEWTLAIDRKIDEAKAAAAALLPGLKAKAADARRRSAAPEISALQARVQKWGYPDLQTEFEKILADTPPAPVAADPSGLVAYFPLDEGSGGTFAEATNKVPAGTLRGATWSTGRHGGGLRFDGDDSWAQVPAAPALDSLPGGSYTIAAWFQADQLPPGKGDANDAAYALVVKTGMHTGISYGATGAFGMIQWFKADDATKSLKAAAGTSSYPAGVFHHVAGVLDRGTGKMTLYVNGKAAANEKFDPTVRAWPYTTPWRLGIGGPHTKEFRWCAKGVLDEVRFYSRALSAAEIGEVFRDPGLPRPSDGPPWRPVFDGKTSNCLREYARADWLVRDGCLSHRPGVDKSAQTLESFGDGELRVRFESRGNTNVWFQARQGSAGGYFIDVRQQLGTAANQGEHELIFTMRGPAVSATVDGRPVLLEVRGASPTGALQFNCSPEGVLRIRSIDFRELK